MRKKILTSVDCDYVLIELVDSLAGLAADTFRGDELGLHPDEMAANFVGFLERSSQWFLLIEDVNFPTAHPDAPAKQLFATSSENEIESLLDGTRTASPDDMLSTKPAVDDVYFKFLHCIWNLSGGRVMITSRLGPPAANELLRDADVDYHCLSLDEEGRALEDEVLLQIFEKRVQFWSGQPLDQV
jgi:hypothetical protein